MSRLPPNASVATALDGGKLTNPSAQRNAAAIVKMLQQVAPARGHALEIASGTGQHVLALATALPALEWHPSDIAPDRLGSIDAYTAELPNVLPARMLDATQDGWATEQTPFDLIYLGNLLHLISAPAARIVLTQAARALAPAGTLVVYGPFMRGGTLTSDGDAKFHADLQAADPDIGYKDDAWIKEVLTAGGLVRSMVRDMPANNLSFIARRESL
ncbi:DUF938 domain-containing protein [Sulfitobacter sp.]|uniref:DUF938 domain-containing protein n=1 Tax=Sulfitobacter sp. TaxID=1903071 RepID=UPI0030021C04